MKPDEIKQHLTDEEKALWHSCKTTLEQDTQPLPTSAGGVVADLTIDALERLAACRKQNAERGRLMEKHHWEGAGSYDDEVCIECGANRRDGDTKACLWAQAIKGE